MPEPIDLDKAQSHAMLAAEYAFDQQRRLADFAGKLSSPEGHAFYKQSSEIAISDLIAKHLVHYAYYKGNITLDEVEASQTPI